MGAYSQGQIDISFKWWVLGGVIVIALFNLAGSIIFGSDRDQTSSSSSSESEEVDDLIEIEPGDTLIISGEGKTREGRSTQRVNIAVKKRR